MADAQHSVVDAKRLYALMRQWLADGTYGPGDQLPTESELTAEYKVSRRTVRLVMIRLSAEGLLDSRHGVGYFVRGRRPPWRR